MPDRVGPAALTCALTGSGRRQQPESGAAAVGTFVHSL